MNRAIWEQAFRDAVWLLMGCALMMFGFHWLLVYLTSFISTSSFVEFMSDLPDQTHGMFGLSIGEAASWRGRIGLGYVDPTVVVISAVWAIARGSDAVSGPLDRGTMEMILAQPVSRIGVLVAHSGVTCLGAAAIGGAAWLGTWTGIATVSVEQSAWFGLVKSTVPLHTLLDSRDYIPSAINLFCLTLFAAALTALVSACGRYRWRTIGLVGGFYLVQIMIKVAGLMASHLDWLFYLTFLGAYWPQRLAVAAPEDVARLSLQYNGVLLGGAVAGYLLAAVIFSRRDLPAPL